tara:strand:- start:2496 stop:4073 length:1578 start_codon:yes stop_codon:yes gene_type:complete
MRYKPSNIQNNNLLSMMQTGGRVSRGKTAVRRAKQRRYDKSQIAKTQRREAKRQKRGGLLGSIGGLAGGLLGSALVATTGPLGLALAAGLGTAGGSLLGQKLGYGKGKTKLDRKGTVYAQDAFSDVSRAGSDYRSGMGERALKSGIKAGLMAGVSGLGKGLYGKVAGKLRKAPVQGEVLTKNIFDQPLQSYSRLSGDALSVPSSLGKGFTPIAERTFAPISDDSLLSFIGPPPFAQGIEGNPFEITQLLKNINFQDGGYVPGDDFMDYDQTADTIYSNIPGNYGYTASTPTPTIGEEMRAGIRQRRKEVAQRALDREASVLAQGAESTQYGGGFDKASLLGDEYNLTPDQLKLITDVDTSPITEMATQGTEALSRLSGQPAMATAQTGLGLGAATYQAGQQRQDIQEGFEAGVEQFREDVRSDLEGQVAGLIEEGATISEKGEGGMPEFATAPSTLQVATDKGGVNLPSFEITVGGEPHYWSLRLNKYLSKEDWNTMIMGPPGWGDPNFHGDMQSFQDSQTGQIA